MARFSRVAFVSVSMLLPSVAFRVKPKRKGDSSSHVSVGNKVVTLGDSYSSGVGIHRSGGSYSGGDCWQERQTTPGGRLASASGQDHVQVACSGGQIPDIHRQFDALHESNPQDFAAGWANSTILFTIGGNDIRTHSGETWPNLLTSCIMSFYGACHQKHENQIANWDQLQSSLTQLYTKVVQDAPNARIRVMGYPRLMQRKVFCMPVPGLAFGAADWADQQVDELNRRLRAAVDAVRSQNSALIQNKSETVMDKLQEKATAGGTAFVSTFEATLKRKGTPSPAPTPAPPPPPASKLDIQFVDPYMYYGRGACRVSRREVNALVLDGFSLSDSSFHPSQRGYDRYFAALEDSVGGSYPMNVAYANEATDPAELMHVLEGWDANKDGKLDMDEVLAMDVEEDNAAHKEQLRSIFVEADADGDNFLNSSEFEVFMAMSDSVDEAEGN